jgi:hypothetical protein
MIRFHSILAWLLSSLGVTLLLLSLVLAPSNLVLADGGGGSPNTPGNCGLGCDPNYDCLHNSGSQDCSKEPNCDTSKDGCGGCSCVLDTIPTPHICGCVAAP